MRQSTVRFTLVTAVTLATLAASGAVLANPVTEFVNESGYQPVTADSVWQKVNDSLGSDASSLFLPAADLGPMPLSVYALDSLETPLERTRFRLRYGVDWVQDTPGSAPTPVSYVEVTRFNLGPAIRADLVKSLCEQNVANPEAFGVGPHTSWRFVTQPVMGNKAMIMAAGRTEIDEQAAHREMCLGEPCTSISTVIDDAAPWGEMKPAKAKSSQPLANDHVQTVSPAMAINQLLGEVDSIESDRPPAAPARPDWAIEAIIETNLGQDLGLEVAYRWGNLLDDSVGTLWQRLSTIGMGEDEPTVFRAEAFECNRGPAFAPPGEYCP